MEIGAIFILAWVLAIIAYIIIKTVKDGWFELRNKAEIILSVAGVVALGVAILFEIGHLLF